MVEGGLAEGEVVRFVEELIAQYQLRLKQKETSPAQSFSKQLLEDAAREAARTRMRAKQEAGIEASRTLAEAKQEAQHLLGQARIRAQEITEQTVQEILFAANKKAELTENRAQQLSHLMLIRAREDVQESLTGDVKAAYYRLLSVVEGLLSATQEIEADWKGKTAQLWHSPSLGLTTGETSSSALLGSLQEEETSLDLASLEREILERGAEAEKAELGEEEKEKAPAAAFEQRPTAGEAEEAPTLEEAPAEEIGSPVVVKTRREEGPPLPPSGEERPEAALRFERAGGLREETPPETRPQEREEPPQEELRTEKEPEEKEDRPQAVPSQLPPTEGVSAEAPRAHVALDGSGSAQEAAPAVAAEQGKPSPPENVGADVYTGEVELVLSPPVEAGRVSELYTYLQTLPGVRVLHIAGSWDKGTVITLSLDRPTRLRSLLENLSGIQVSPGVEVKGRPKSGLSAMGGKTRRRAQINIAFTAR